MQTTLGSTLASEQLQVKHMLQNIIEDDDADDNDDNNCNTDEKTLVMTITQVPLFCSSWQTFALAASTSESKI